MTSSLKSKFSFGNKRAFYVTGDRLFVYPWHNGELQDPFVFNADDTGLLHVERYLQESENDPAYLLVDVVEEEFRQDTVPHVFGRDRRSVTERKQARLFRGARYCHAIAQGREPDGRRDDKILFTALTNSDVVARWIEILDQYKVPLAGIYSLRVLTGTLLQKLQADAENALVITLHSASGLRESFFRGGELKISRLATMQRLGSEPLPEYLLGELEKLRRYLNSLRLISRDHPLDAYILVHGEFLAELRQQCRDSDVVRYHLFDVADVQSDLGLSVRDTPFCDSLFAALLLKTAPKNHYALPEETRYYGLHKTRISMLAASVVLLLSSLVWSGFNFIEGVSLKQQALDAEQKADHYQARYDMAKESLPPTAVEPLDVQMAVDVVDTLVRYKTNPLEIMRVISRVLEAFPTFQLDQIDWMGSVDPNATPQYVAAGGLSQLADNISTDPGDFDYFQIAKVKGHLAPFDGNYRRALTEVTRFADILRGLNIIQDVRIIDLPLDISSDAKLEGNASVELPKEGAHFTLTVVLGINHGTS